MINKQKNLFIWGFIGIILISGCISKEFGEDDTIKIAQSLPAVKEFLADHPSAEIRAALWNKNVVEQNIDDIRNLCGQQMEITSYWKVVITEDDLNLEVWIDEKTKKPVCILTKGKQEKKSTTTTERHRAREYFSVTLPTGDIHAGDEVVITVANKDTKNPVEKVDVDVYLGDKKVAYGMTDDNGVFKFTPAEAGEYRIVLDKSRYHTVEEIFTVSSGAAPTTTLAPPTTVAPPATSTSTTTTTTERHRTREYFSVTLPTGDIHAGDEVVITVANKDTKNPVEKVDVDVYLGDKKVAYGMTDDNGVFKFTPAEAGEYRIVLDKSRYHTVEEIFTVSSGAAPTTTLAPPTTVAPPATSTSTTTTTTERHRTREYFTIDVIGDKVNQPVTITVTNRDAGNPVDKADVDVYFNYVKVAYGLTDTTGIFVFTPTQVGDYRIVVDKSRYHTTEVTFSIGL